MVLQRYVFNQWNGLNARSEDHDVAGITARICTTLNTLETYQIDHSRVQPLASLKYSSVWPNPRTRRKLAYMFC